MLFPTIVLKKLITPRKLRNLIDFLFVGPKGYIVEVGVFKGGSIGTLAKCFPKRRFYGYDTFEGIPQHCQLDNIHRKGNFFSDYNKVKRALIPFKNITLIKGIYPESDSIKPQPIALAHVDVDIYKSTLESFFHLTPLMAKGGRIYCDDAFVPSCEGATIALKEYCSKFNFKYNFDSKNKPHIKHAYVQF